MSEPYGNIALLALCLPDGRHWRRVAEICLRLTGGCVYLVKATGVSKSIGADASRRDRPPFAWLSELFGQQRERALCIFVLLPDAADLETLIREVEAVTGSLELPENGIAVAMNAKRLL